MVDIFSKAANSISEEEFLERLRQWQKGTEGENIYVFVDNDGCVQLLAKACGFPRNLEAYQC